MRNKTMRNVLLALMLASATAVQAANPSAPADQISNKPDCKDFSTKVGIRSVELHWVVGNDAGIIQYKAQFSYDGTNFTTFEVVQANIAGEYKAEHDTWETPVRKVYYRVVGVYVNRDEIQVCDDLLVLVH